MSTNTNHKHDFRTIAEIAVIIACLGAAIASATTIACQGSLKKNHTYWSFQTGTISCDTLNGQTNYLADGGTITHCSKIVYNPNGVTTHYCWSEEYETYAVCSNTTAQATETDYAAPIEGGCPNLPNSPYCGTYVVWSGPNVDSWPDTALTEPSNCD